MLIDQEEDNFYNQALKEMMNLRISDLEQVDRWVCGDFESWEGTS